MSCAPPRPCRASPATRPMPPTRRGSRIWCSISARSARRTGSSTWSMRSRCLRPIRAPRRPLPADRRRPASAGGGRLRPPRRGRRAVHLHRHGQRRRETVPHAVLGRPRRRAGAEERLVRPQHRQQDRRIHVLRPADRLLRPDRGAGLGRRGGGLRDAGRRRGDGRGDRRAARRPGAARGDGRVRARPPVRRPRLRVFAAAPAVRLRRGLGAMPRRARGGAAVVAAAAATYSGLMYERFYGLYRAPFAVTPDPSLLYMSRTHREALATIIYGIETRKGFVVCTGEVGTGKTTVIRAFFDQAESDKYRIVYIFTPQVSPLEMARFICRELGMEEPESVFAAVPALQLKLLEIFEGGRTAVLMVDEAQLLPAETIEFLRLLSNFETDTEKLIQIVLVGQSEIDAVLARRDMRQVAQRVALRARLGALGPEESLD